MKGLYLTFICIGLLAVSALGQTRDCYHVAWNGSSEILYATDLQTGDLDTIGVIPGVSSLINLTSTFDADHQRYIFRSNLGITEVNTQDASVINTFNPPVSNYSLLEFDTASGNCYYIAWNGTSELLYSTNLNTGVHSTIGVIPGVTSLINNTSTFNGDSGHYIFQSNLGITVVNIQDASVVNAFVPPITNYSLLEYDANSGKCFYVAWNGSAEILYSTDLNTGVHQTVGVIPGVTSLINLTSTFDTDNAHYIFRSNLGITEVNTQNASVVNVYNNPANFSLLEFSGPCATYDTISVQACASYLSPSEKYTWTMSGSYSDTLVNAAGCDSILTIDLTILPLAIDSISVTACDGYVTPGGTVVSESGTYSDTLLGAASNGCDSIVVIELVVHLNNCPPVLSNNLCGTTVSALTDQIPYTAFPGATNYRYRITTGNTSFVHVRGSAIAHFTFAIVPGIQYNTTYTVEVAALVNDAWTAWGPACTLTTPALAPTSHLSPASCGITVSSINSWLFCAYVPGASNYRYEVSNSSGFYQVYTRGWSSTAFRMGFVTGVANSTTYQVRVAAMVNGVWGPYGAACSITTPSFGALPSLFGHQCNTTMPVWQTYIFYSSIPGATAYRIEFTSGAFNTVYVRNTPNPLLRLDWVPGLTVGTTYSVRVAARVGGVWSAYGPACSMTTPAAARLSQIVPQDNAAFSNENNTATAELNVSLFPNPNNGQFQIDLGKETSATVSLFSTTGALVHQQRLKQRFNELEVSQLPSGLYLVKVEAEGLVVFERMIVE